MAQGRPRGAGDSSTRNRKIPPAPVVWREARGLLHDHRRTLAIGFALMLVSRVAGLVTPASSKFFIDEVVGKARTDLLLPLAAAIVGATIVQATTSFLNSQVISVTAQRAITDMRRKVEAHVVRLPVKYFDSTQTGVLISRIMTDADGIRNLVGTGVVQLVGGLLTAIFAMAWLFWVNWQLTVAILLLLLFFGSMMAMAFSRLRPIFRERGAIHAEVTGRLAETLGGVRVVKAYSTEKREDRVFTRGVHRLFRNVAKTITGTSAVGAFGTVVVGSTWALVIVVGGRALAAGTMTVGDLFSYVIFTGLMAAPIIQIASIGTQISEAFAGLDRIREVLDMDTERDEDRDRAPRAMLSSRTSTSSTRRASPCCAMSPSRLPRARPRLWSDRAGQARARSSAW